jgi:hypothetical protein
MLVMKNATLAYFLPIGSLLGMGVCTVRGGAFCMRHLANRVLLAWQKVIPWRWSGFLDNAVDHVFLIRQGDSYRFVHRLLQEHLAASARRQV